MIEIVPFRPDHLSRLELQPVQRLCGVSYQTGAEIARHCQAFTGLAGGQVVGIAGFMEQWRGRAVAWALLSESAGPHMVQISRAVDREIRRAPWHRVEAHVAPDFEAGIRLVRLLRFEFEGLMARFLPNGEDASLWARVKHG